MGMTVIEKILARASGAEKVSPGQLVVADVDTTVILDMAFLANVRREIHKLHAPERIVVIFDHLIPAPDRNAADAHVKGREFVRRFGIERFHDVGHDQGISHVIVAENGYARPGTVLVCSDSHTCAAGAFNCAARGVGNPDMLYAATMGKAWYRLGGTFRYDLVGQLRPGVSAKDVFLYMAGLYGDHANQNIEFGGPGLAHLSIDARRTLATMGAEFSAEFVTMEPDQILIDYMNDRNVGPFEPAYPDADAQYVARHTIELDKLEPMVALPDAVVNNSVPVREVAGTPIDQAYVGSCANGTFEDLADAARVVAGRRVAPGVRFYVTPGSQQIYRRALAAGHVGTLVDAGAVVTSATCGACFGGHTGILGPAETCITSSTRNFKGRMGDPSAKIYMASSATVAAAAIAGTIVEASTIDGGRA